MIERFIYTAIQQGIVDLQADPTLITVYFRKIHGLSLDEVNHLLEVFIKLPPNVQHGYARTDSKFPLYAIILSSENEVNRFLGDDGSLLDQDDEEDPRNVEHLSRIWSHQHMILCYHDNPDVVLFYYHLVKFFLIRARRFFFDNHVLETTLSGGDLAPDPRYIPAGLFARQLTVSCTKELKVSGLKEATAFKIDGIFVQDGRPPEEIGNVTALVTVRADGEPEELDE